MRCGTSLNGPTNTKLLEMAPFIFMLEARETEKDQL
jgi:hypothetical protein